MKKHPSVKWSTAVRAIIEQKISDFDEAEEVAKKSKFNWKVWKPVNIKISKNTAKHAERLLHESNS